MNKILQILNKPFKWFFVNLKITNNSKAKIFSVIFAILFWAFVMDQENPEITKWISNVLVELQNQELLLDEGLIIMGAEKRFVDVEVKGRRSDVMSINSNDIRVTANLIGYGKGTNSIPLEKNIIDENVKISDISPQDIKIFIDRIVEVPKPVEIEYIGESADGYLVDGLKLSNDKVMVKGPEKYVNSVSCVKGEFDIMGINSESSQNVPLFAVDIDDEIVSNVTCNVKYVDAVVDVKKVKEIKVIPDVVGSLPSGYRLVDVELSEKVVKTKANESIVDELESVFTEPIELNGLTSKLSVEKKLLLPNGVQTISGKNIVNITLDVQKLETKTFSFTKQDVFIKNGESFITNDEQKMIFNKYYFKLDSESIDTKVTDISKVLDEVDMDDITLYIDLDGLKLGQHNVPIKFMCKKDVHDISVEPSRVNIELSVENDQSFIEE